MAGEGEGMKLKDKLEWAKRAFDEIARDCEQVADLIIVDKAEQRAWKSIAKKCKRNIQVLSQT